MYCTIKVTRYENKPYYTKSCTCMFHYTMKFPEKLCLYGIMYKNELFQATDNDTLNDNKRIHYSIAPSIW